MKTPIALFATIIIFLSIFINSATAFAVTTRPKYDSHGRLQSFEIFEGASVAITYDANGNILEIDFDESEAEHITVTFNANGGTFVNPEDATRILPLHRNIGILPRANPARFYREGYRFAGWFENLNNSNTLWYDNKQLSADITLHAQWTPAPPNFVLGDVNRSGYVSSADATILAKHISTASNILSESNITTQNADLCLLSADVDGDGLVTISDLVALSRWLIGFPLHQD